MDSPMNDQQQITPQEALDWLRAWERQVAPGSPRRAWYAQIIACVEGLVVERDNALAASTPPGATEPETDQGGRHA